MNIKLLYVFLIFSCALCAQDNEIRHYLSGCQKISDNSKRLACYDGIASANQTEVDTTQKNDNSTQMPVLLADLEEPRIFLSMGRMDFLDKELNSILLGVGTRLKLKSFDFDKHGSVDFNFISLIKSQFDVDELDTRNNRGGALINTDFMIGGELVKAYDFGHVRLKYTHRSTHLGDEFLIDNPQYLEDRLNLSYETIDLLAYRDINQWGGYFGVGAVVRSEPGDLDNFQFQSGLQYRGETAKWFTPIVGLDFKSWQAANWHVNTSLKAGFEYSGYLNRPVQFMLEYYDGKSPYGQFINEDFEFFGFSVNHYW